MHPRGLPSLHFKLTNNGRAKHYGGIRGSFQLAHNGAVDGHHFCVHGGRGEVGKERYKLLYKPSDGFTSSKEKPMYYIRMASVLLLERLFTFSVRGCIRLLASYENTSTFSLAG